MFGPDRLVWGSDVGQSMLWDYPTKVSMAREAAGDLTAEETARFLHDNAARIFRLEATSAVPGMRDRSSAA